MRSTNLPLFDLFQRQRRYVVPLFQRPYVWEQEEQWEPLRQDIAGRAEAVLERDSRGSRSDKIGSHFLGAIVLEIARQSALRLNTYFQNVLAWDEAEILRRGEVLLQDAKRVRPHPAGAL